MYIYKKKTLIGVPSMGGFFSSYLKSPRNYSLYQVWYKIIFSNKISFKKKL